MLFNIVHLVHITPYIGDDKAKTLDQSIARIMVCQPCSFKAHKTSSLQWKEEEEEEQQQQQQEKINP